MTESLTGFHIDNKEKKLKMIPEGNDISNTKPAIILGMLKSIKLCSIDTTLSATQA